MHVTKFQVYVYNCHHISMKTVNQRPFFKFLCNYKETEREMYKDRNFSRLCYCAFIRFQVCVSGSIIFTPLLNDENYVAYIKYNGLNSRVLVDMYREMKRLCC
jgi:hypothetical protein